MKHWEVLPKLQIALNAMVYPGSTLDGRVNTQLTRPPVELTRLMVGGA